MMFVGLRDKGNHLDEKKSGSDKKRQLENMLTSMTNHLISVSIKDCRTSGSTVFSHLRPRMDGSVENMPSLLNGTNQTILVQGNTNNS